MLETLRFRDVGPAPALEIAFSKRINLLVGDNGLGKTFLLDAAWWALTRTWARPKLKIMPHAAQQASGAKADPLIAYRYSKKTPGSFSHESSFDRRSEKWSVKQARPAMPGMVVYAQADGAFAVWDPARNYWGHDSADRPAAYVFQSADVWDGLSVGEKRLCEGLIRDWASWQREAGDAFEQLTTVLGKLSASEAEPLRPGALTRISLDDSRDHPTLQMPYGRDVPLVHASAGMRRVVALAYLLVWTWQEHLRATELLGSKPVTEIIFLIDEIEAHLHPQWQRRIVPALLQVMEALTGSHEVSVQLISATHSPLVLASVEPYFDHRRDAVWELDLQDGVVTLEQFAWTRRGDANAWLTSSLFDLRAPRSFEAEKALARALELLREDAPNVEAIASITKDLQAVLSDIDPFWVRWSAFAEEQGAKVP